MSAYAEVCRCMDVAEAHDATLKMCVCECVRMLTDADGCMRMQVCGRRRGARRYAQDISFYSFGAPSVCVCVFTYILL